MNSCLGGNCDGEQTSSISTPADRGEGQYSDGCMSCGQVAPIAAGSAEEGYECGDCYREHSPEPGDGSPPPLAPGFE